MVVLILSFRNDEIFLISSIPDKPLNNGCCLLNSAIFWKLPDGLYKKVLIPTPILAEKIASAVQSERETLIASKERQYIFSVAR